MGDLLRFDLRGIAGMSGARRWLETGVGNGDNLAWALKCGFKLVEGVEADPRRLTLARSKVMGQTHVRLREGLSTDFLREVTAKPDPDPKIIALHTHAPTESGEQPTGGSDKAPRVFPLLEELQCLSGWLGQRDILILPDMYHYWEGGFQLGECPPTLRRWHERGRLDTLLNEWKETHTLVTLKMDRGYALLVPHDLAQRVGGWIMVRPHDAAQQPLTIQGGVPGVTSISILRRLHDARFATRYFLGDGIDVGGGTDSLALFKEFFPSIRHLFIYDQNVGDGQMLANVHDDSFDFLYSCHCMEHLRDPLQALRNWIRVVKPGGHLVFQVPDEDLYEQEQWPSRYNTDHKLTFTMAKKRSWSPVSVNMLDLVGQVRDGVRILSVSTMDLGYRYELKGRGFDQTRTPMAEAGIEVVLRKLPPSS